METSKHKNRQVSIVNELKPKLLFDTTPFNPLKYHKWKQDHYHKNEFGYYNDVVVGFRNYYTELELLNEYNQLKKWCEDPNDEEVFKNFRFSFKFDLYF